MDVDMGKSIFLLYIFWIDSLLDLFKLMVYRSWKINKKQEKSQVFHSIYQTSNQIQIIYYNKIA
jgi:hypothetical protein